MGSYELFIKKSMKEDQTRNFANNSIDMELTWINLHSKQLCLLKIEKEGNNMLKFTDANWMRQFPIQSNGQSCI